MIHVAMVGLMLAMALEMARALLGPSVFDRVLAVNAFGTATVLFIAVVGFLTERPDWAPLYAVINFSGPIAVLKYLKYRDLGRAGVDEDP